MKDTLISHACAAALGRQIEIRGIQFEYISRGSLVFRVKEIDFRSMWRGEDSAVGRFVAQNNLDELLEVKDSRWVLKPRKNVWYLRVLAAHSGEISIKGGLRIDNGRVSKWNATLCLPKKLSKRFPQIFEKRFAQDTFGRRLFKMTWASGRWRLWGQLGPVLEAKWQ